MPAYRILSLDGGGVRGAFGARLLERLQAATGLLDETDLVAGTSAGGITALALAAGVPPEEITSLYLEHARRIFSAPLLRRLQDGVVAAKYPSGALREAVASVLHELTLGELRAHAVLVSSFDLDSEATDAPRSWKPKLFHNLDNADGQGDRRVRAVDVALRTSAAPVYFPTSSNSIDGGVFANNPAMAALALAANPNTDQGAGRALADIRLLSLGTGLNARWIAGDHDWGLLEWGKRLVDILVDGTTGVASYECAAMLGPRFHRLDPVLREEVPLDAGDRVRDLVDWADREPLERTVAWIRETYLAPAAPGATGIA
jgi:patatin-like phospholipase/acyl hydrolase